MGGPTYGVCAAPEGMRRVVGELLARSLSGLGRDHAGSMSCRVVIGVADGASQQVVRAIVATVLPAGGQVLDASRELPDVVVVRMREDLAPAELLVRLRAIPGVTYAQQERMYQSLD